jgi:hypothetical protein
MIPGGSVTIIPPSYTGVRTRVRLQRERSPLKTQWEKVASPDCVKYSCGK